MTNPISDEPVRFYLEHRSLIREWAALESPTRDVARGVLSAIALSLEDRVPTPGLQMVREDPSGYGIAAWHQPEWVDPSGRPLVAIGLGWNVNRLSFFEDEGERPWVGIWRGERSQGDPLASAVRQKAEPLLAEHGFRPTKWDTWPVYRYVPGPSGAFWDDLEPWTAQVMQATSACWDAFSPVVQAVVQGTS